MRQCVERRIAGRYNLCNPPGAVTIGDVLETSKRLANAGTTFVWADAAFLEKNKLLESGEIPIWSPTTGEFAGAALVSSARAVAQGLRFRDLETTVRDTLAWHDQRPPAQKEKLRAGLTAEREAALLKAIEASGWLTITKRRRAAKDRKKEWEQGCRRRMGAFQDIGPASFILFCGRSRLCCEAFSMRYAGMDYGARESDDRHHRSRRR